MRNQKAVFLGPVIAILFLSSAIARTDSFQTPQPAAKPLPTVDQVLDGYVTAIGGKAAIEKVTSRWAKGTIEIAAAGITGTVEAYEKAPNKSLEVTVLTGFGEIREGFDGSIGWSQDPQTGLREKSGIELASARRGADIHKSINFRKLYPKIEVEGAAKVGERDAVVLVATPEEGSPEKWYFDTQTNYLLRTDLVVESPLGKTPVEGYFEDYREVEGVKLPFLLRQSIPAYTAVIKFQEIKTNVPIEDSMFAKPKAQ